MRFLWVVCLCVVAPLTASANEWYFNASLEGGAVFWTYTNDTGEVSPRRQKTNEIWVSRSNEVQNFGQNGACTFNNCWVTFYLNGELPAPGSLVTIAFSNGETFQFQGNGTEEALNNSATIGMGTTNNVIRNIRGASWIDVSFDGMAHRFSLSGSSAALDEIAPYLQ